MMKELERRPSIFVASSLKTTPPPAQTQLVPEPRSALMFIPSSSYQLPLRSGKFQRKFQHLLSVDNKVQVVRGLSLSWPGFFKKKKQSEFELTLGSACK